VWVERKGEEGEGGKGKKEMAVQRSLRFRSKRSCSHHILLPKRKKRKLLESLVMLLGHAAFQEMRFGLEGMVLA